MGLKKRLEDGKFWKIREKNKVDQCDFDCFSSDLERLKRVERKKLSE